MNPRRTLTITTALVVALVAVSAVTGCANKTDPEPSTNPPTTTAAPQEERTPNPQSADDQAAIQTYKDFIATYNKVGQDGYANFRDDLARPYAYDEYFIELVDELAPRAAAGAHQTGEITLSDFRVVERTPHPVIPATVLEACEDSTGFDVVMPDGTSRLKAGTTGRFVATTTVVNHQRLNKWLISMSTVDRGRPC